MIDRRLPRAAVGLQVAAALAVLVCWLVASDRVEAGDQMAPLSAAAAVVIVAVCVNASIVVVMRRAVLRKARALRAWATVPVATASTAPNDPPALDISALVTVAGATMAHSPHCPLVAGKSTGNAKAGLARCGVCAS